MRFRWFMRWLVPFEVLIRLDRKMNPDWVITTDLGEYECYEYEPKWSVLLAIKRKEKGAEDA